MRPRNRDSCPPFSPILACISLPVAASSSPASIASSVAVLIISSACFCVVPAICVTFKAALELIHICRAKSNCGVSGISPFLNSSGALCLTILFSKRRPNILNACLYSRVNMLFIRFSCVSNAPLLPADIARVALAISRLIGFSALLASCINIRSCNACSRVGVRPVINLVAINPRLGNIKISFV